MIVEKNMNVGKYERWQEYNKKRVKKIYLKESKEENRESARMCIERVIAKVEN
jgi:hypothetical protein